MSKGAQITLAAVSVFIGIVWLSAGSSGEGTFAYYTNIADYRTARATSEGRDSRVHGFVMEGSIRKDLRAGFVDFEIRDEQGTTLPVRFQGIDLPDLFGDGAEVVVEGQLQGSTFLAQRVLAKCPSKYEVAPGAEA